VAVVANNVKRQEKAMRFTGQQMMDAAFAAQAERARKERFDNQVHLDSARGLVEQLVKYNEDEGYEVETIDVVEPLEMKIDTARASAAIPRQLCWYRIVSNKDLPHREEGWIALDSKTGSFTYAEFLDSEETVDGEF
jgi:hypothetical protein